MADRLPCEFSLTMNLREHKCFVIKENLQIFGIKDIYHFISYFFKSRINQRNLRIN